MKIIFFDGTCGLCHWFVRFVLTRDGSQCFHFAPLQGETAKKMGIKTQDYLTVIFLDEGRGYERSEAACRIAAYLPTPWSWLRYLRVLPKRFRDFCYNFVANRRAKWFGIQEKACWIPKNTDQSRFLK